MQQAVPTIGLGSLGGLQCVTGRFNLLVFIQIVPPVSGDVIGQIQPLTGGNPIPVIQTQPTNIPLSAVDNQIITLCGRFVVRRGQLVLDVRFVLPFTPPPPAPPLSLQQLLLLLFLLGLLGRPPFGFGKGLGGLGQLGAPGTPGTTTTTSQ